jgi:hypothetical protein
MYARSRDRSDAPEVLTAYAELLGRKAAAAVKGIDTYLSSVGSKSIWEWLYKEYWDHRDATVRDVKKRINDAFPAVFTGRDTRWKRVVDDAQARLAQLLDAAKPETGGPLEMLTRVVAFDRTVFDHALELATSAVAYGPDLVPSIETQRFMRYAADMLTYVMSLCFTAAAAGAAGGKTAAAYLESSGDTFESWYVSEKAADKTPNMFQLANQLAKLRRLPTRDAFWRLVDFSLHGFDKVVAKLCARAAYQNKTVMQLFEEDLHVVSGLYETGFVDRAVKAETERLEEGFTEQKKLRWRVFSVVLLRELVVLWAGRRDMYEGEFLRRMRLNLATYLLAPTQFDETFEFSKLEELSKRETTGSLTRRPELNKVLLLCVRAVAADQTPAQFLAEHEDFLDVKIEHPRLGAVVRRRRGSRSRSRPRSRRQSRSRSRSRSQSRSRPRRRSRRQI